MRIRNENEDSKNARDALRRSADAKAVAQGKPFRITVLGFGEVGRAYVSALTAQGVPATVFHPSPSARTRLLVEEAGVDLTTDAAAAYSRCDLALNVGPGDQALATAQVAASALPPHALFADLTSAAPDSIRAAADCFAAEAYVDAAILGAVSIHGHRTPLLASGRSADRLKAMLEPLGFAIDAMPDSAPGDASTLKLVRSVLTKGMDAVIIECLLVAEAVGLRDALLGRIGDLDRSSFSELMAMFVRTHAPHALRRLHEMEAATTALSGLGVPLYMTEGVLQRYARSVATLGEKPQLPDGSAGPDLYAQVIPWMLAAERGSWGDGG